MDYEELPRGSEYYKELLKTNNSAVSPPKRDRVKTISYIRRPESTFVPTKVPARDVQAVVIPSEHDADGQVKAKGKVVSHGKPRPYQQVNTSTYGVQVPFTVTEETPRPKSFKKSNMPEKRAVTIGATTNLADSKPQRPPSAERSRPQSGSLQNTPRTRVDPKSKRSQIDLPSRSSRPSDATPSNPDDPLERMRTLVDSHSRQHEELVASQSALYSYAAATNGAGVAKTSPGMPASSSVALSGFDAKQLLKQQEKILQNQEFLQSQIVLLSQQLKAQMSVNASPKSSARSNSSATLSASPRPFVDHTQPLSAIEFQPQAPRPAEKPVVGTSPNGLQRANSSQSGRIVVLDGAKNARFYQEEEEDGVEVLDLESETGLSDITRLELDDPSAPPSTRSEPAHTLSQAHAHSAWGEDIQSATAPSFRYSYVVDHKDLNQRLAAGSAFAKSGVSRPSSARTRDSGASTPLSSARSAASEPVFKVTVKSFGPGVAEMLPKPRFSPAPSPQVPEDHNSIADDRSISALTPPPPSSRPTSAQSQPQLRISLQIPADTGFKIPVGSVQISQQRPPVVAPGPQQKLFEATPRTGRDSKIWYTPQPSPKTFAPSTKKPPT